MTAALHPIRTLRDTFQQINAAVNASRELTRSSAARTTEPASPASIAIPL